MPSWRQSCRHQKLKKPWRSAFQRCLRYPNMLRYCRPCCPGVMTPRCTTQLLRAAVGHVSQKRRAVAIWRPSPPEIMTSMLATSKHDECLPRRPAANSLGSLHVLRYFAFQVLSQGMQPCSAVGRCSARFHLRTYRASKKFITTFCQEPSSATTVDCPKEAMLDNSAQFRDGIT